ncbi:MAG: dienelactone hydrolase family protein [Sandaracinaceae bacterium]|nr:dienelactone hydrolase family protein [Sandaracinaceae bacterium]
MAGRPVRHDVYARGEGPPVVVLQELPGIEAVTLAFADRLVRAGYHVELPHLFGPLGRYSVAGNLARAFCMREELAIFSARRSSPLVEWLRALCRDVAARTGAPGVGVIGMCLTGNFALSLIADDAVLAAVASQPSTPIAPQAGLHMSDAEIAASRAALDARGPMLALRFERDQMCGRARFDAIERAFNDDRERVRLVTIPGAGHAVLTHHFVDREGHPTREALDTVLAYFAERLR